MSMQLNIGDHKSPVPHFLTIPLEHREAARWARKEAKRIAAKEPRADVYFRKLPSGRSLTALLADRSIWVNYTLDNLLGQAFTHQKHKEIGIGWMAFRKGKQQVLGSLIHELAHINGAGDDSHAAEEAVYHCGLGTAWEYYLGWDDPSTPYIPGHIG